MTKTRVGILGGGQLGRMITEAANRLTIQTNILDADNSPAKQISAHGDHVTGSFIDRQSLHKLAKACDVLTVEIEHVDTYALEEVGSEVKVEPSWRTIRTIQDKFQQKEHLAKFNIPMAEHRELHSEGIQELSAIGEELGYPFMLKAKTGAYDGRGELHGGMSSLGHILKKQLVGNYCVKSQQDLSSALKALQGRPLYAEKWAGFRMVGSNSLQVVSLLSSLSSRSAFL